MIDLQYLRYLVEVGKQGGFSRAAEALHVTQPAVSKAVQLLEEDLDAKLLVRTPRSVQLTDAGRVVTQYAQMILHQIDTMRAELHSVEGLAKGELRLGLPPLVLRELFTSELCRFHQLYPGIQLNISEYGWLEMASKIQAGEVDLGVFIAMEDNPQIEMLPIEEGYVILVVPKESPWAGRRINLTEVKQETFVTLADSFYITRRFQNECRANRFEPHIASQSAHWEFLADLVKAGLGIAPLPAVLAKRIDRTCLDIAIPDPDIRYTVNIGWKKNGLQSFAAKAFVRVFRKSRQNGDEEHPD